MNIEDLPSNSKRSKEAAAPEPARKVPENVISGGAKIAKKSGVRRLADLLNLQDARDVG